MIDETEGWRQFKIGETLKFNAQAAAYTDAAKASSLVFKLGVEDQTYDIVIDSALSRLAAPLVVSSILTALF
jgi:hypothetical protein